MFPEQSSQEEVHECSSYNTKSGRLPHSGYPAWTNNNNEKETSTKRLALANLILQNDQREERKQLILDYTEITEMELKSSRSEATDTIRIDE